MLRQKVVVAIAILMILLVSVSDAAFIDFDDLAVSTDVKNQYMGNYGVSFNSAHIIKPSEATASGTQALQAGSAGTEYHSGPLIIYFSAGQSNVEMAVGLNTKTIYQYDAILTAFDLAGKQVGAPVTAKVGPGPSPITKSMAISSAQANIWRVGLIYKKDSKESALMEVIDSLEFDTAVKPPPDNQKPVVKITKPKTGDVTQTPFFLLEGTIQENVALADVWLSIEQSGKQPVHLQIAPSRIGGSVPNFTFGGSTLMGLLYEGQNAVTVKATDISNNDDTDSVTVHYQKPPPLPPSTIDLFPTAMEITQGINKVITLPNPPFGSSAVSYPWYGPEPLVQGKRTVVRVYGGVIGANAPVPDVLCELWGRRGGVDLPGSPLYATPMRITLNPADSVDTQRADINLTWNFVLPYTWTDKGGGVDLTAFVNPMQDIMECPPCYNTSNKMYVLDVFFNKTSVLHIHTVPVSLNRSSPNPPGKWPDVLTEKQIIDVFFSKNSAFPQIYPSSILLHLEPTLHFDLDRADGFMSSNLVEDLLDEVADLYFFDFLQLVFNYPSVARTSKFVGLFPGPVLKLVGLGGSFEAVAKVDTTSDAEFWKSSFDVAHEVGHTFDRDHAPCGDVDDVDAKYPQYYGPTGAAYPKASIGEWGMDTRTLELKDPATTYDVMSYCDPQWVSPYTYENLYNKLKATSTLASSSSERMLLAQGAEQREYLFVNGVIEFDGTARLEPFYRFMEPAGMSDEQGQGEYSLQLLDAEDNVLFTRYFNPTEVMDAEQLTLSILQVVPFAEGTVRIVLRHADVILATRTASSNAPVVTVLSPNGDEFWNDTGIESVSWMAQDADADELHYAVLYSADGGQNWKPLAVNVTGNHLEVDAAEVAGSDSALIRVFATDGFNTGTDCSDAPFFVTGKPPVVSLISPVDGASYMQGQLVPLQGMGTDLEDGPLADESFNWESHRDGFLGTGSRLDALTLSPGVHEITLICQDSDGQYGSDAVTIEIIPLPFQIEILNLEAQTFCEPGFSHTIELTWDVKSSSASSFVLGPLTLVASDGETLRFEGPLPSGNGMIVPVNLPAGGLVDVRLDASDTAGNKAFAQQSVMLLPCCQWVVDYDVKGADINGSLPEGYVAAGTEPSDYVITAGGADIWDNADQFYYAFKSIPVSGDFTAIVGVKSMEPYATAHEWAKAGIMARQNLEPGSPHVMIVGTPGNGVAFQGRDVANGESWHIPVGGGYGPDDTVWLRLDRVGDTFIGSYAIGGETPPDVWTASASHDWPFPGGLIPGLATTSHEQGTSIEVNYTDLCFGPYLGPPVLIDPELPEGPAGGEGYMGIREVIDNGEIRDQRACYASLNSGEGRIAEHWKPVLNLWDSGGNGNYGNDDVFGVVTAGHRGYGAVDDLSLIARGTIRIPPDQGGFWTFGVNSDDGCTLQLPGQNFISAVNGEIVNFESGAALRFYGGRGVADTLGLIELLPGDYPFWLTYHEGAVDAAVEFYAAKGAHTSFDPDVFRLVGHQSIGTVPIPGFCDEVTMAASRPGGWGQIDSVQDAMDAVAEGEAHGTNSIRGCAVVNHSDPEDGAADPDVSGSFGADLVFPNDRPGDDDDFAVMVEGLLDIPAAGTYQIGFNSDDGAGIQIFGHSWKSIVPGSDATAVIAGDVGDWLITDALTGWSWTAGEIEFAAAGCYEFRAIMFERGGGSFFELFGRGISPTTGKPDPTWHLLEVGGAGMYEDPDGLQLVTPPGTESGLVGHWQFDEGEGAIAHDSSDYENHMALMGNVHWVESPIGMAGYGLDFDGDGDYLVLEDARGLDFAPGSFSVSARINPRQVEGSWRTILEYDRYSFGGSNWFGIWLNREGGFHFRVGLFTLDSEQKIAPHTWHLVSATYDATQQVMSVYIDGQLDKASVVEGPNTYYNSPTVSKLTIGAYGLEDAEYFDGTIDDLRVYSKTLTAGEVAGLMAGAPGECFPVTNPAHHDWIALGQPHCWCWPYQCDGDADGVTSGFPFNYRVFTGDLAVLVANWKKLAGDPTLNPCADIDHKDSGFPFYYRVFTGDLAKIVANWMKKDAHLAGNCPRP